MMLTIPPDFKTTSQPVPAAFLETMPVRFLVVYPIGEDGYAIHDGHNIRSSGSQERTAAPTAAILNFIADQLTAESSDVIVLDRDARRAWRAPYVSGIAFVLLANPPTG